MRILYLFFLLFSFGILFLRAQNNYIPSDSIATPFREGRWLTGLAGTISSNTNKTKSSDKKTITNEFGLNFSTGKFIKGRWLLGGRLNLNRASSSNNVDRTTESLYVGPFSSYYLSKNNRGSLFTTLSMGYVRYREETSFNDLASPITELAEGGGFGTLFGLGYSYVINDQIAFDIGFDLNIFLVDISQEQRPSGTTASENLTVSNTAFTFGFNVILDDFFF
ncbi:outer membrane beta-barrel protein [uncultured Maribacter sp.]|uniref:outer membrane beta-barrel protein n=1 Tax=uncultured Maribacter sp. TaxID=431308 RepID=UPI002636AD29|nr:outer membrane beta-barrel protein [uncultured Maribacter sp.]